MTFLTNILRLAADCVQANEHHLANELLTRYRQLRESGLDEPRIGRSLWGDSFYKSLRENTWRAPAGGPTRLPWETDRTNYHAFMTRPVDSGGSFMRRLIDRRHLGCT